MFMGWEDDQEWERDWWGSCVNTYAEEMKQGIYAHRMGLLNDPRDGMWPVYDLHGKSVLDIGGGPVSLLLKTVGGGRLVVADPCPYPKWTRYRYFAHGISVVCVAGEELDTSDHFDEVWCYNVLQHTNDPEAIIRNARKIGSVVRLFEWVDLPATIGHPQELKADLLRQWLGGEGHVEAVNEYGCAGATAFYGVFGGAR